LNNLNEQKFGLVARGMSIMLKVMGLILNSILNKKKNKLNEQRRFVISWGSA
jgi:hypothetical protein